MGREIFQSKVSGEVHMRAYVYVPGTMDVQGLSVFGMGERQSPFQGITFNLTEGGRAQISATTADQFVDSGNFTVPRDQWFCVNLDWAIDEARGEVSISIDGATRVTVNEIDTLPAGGFHNALVGIVWSSEMQSSASIGIDEVV